MIRIILLGIMVTSLFCIRAADVGMSLKDEWYRSRVDDSALPLHERLEYVDSVLESARSVESYRYYVMKVDMLYDMGRYRDALNVLEKDMPPIPPDSLRLQYYSIWERGALHFALSEFQVSLDLGYGLLETEKPDSLRYFDFYASLIISDFYIFIGETKLGRKYVDKGIHILNGCAPVPDLSDKEIKRLKNVMTLLSSSLYIKDGMLEKAMAALKDFDMNFAAPVNICSYYCTLARIAEDMGDIEMAENYYKKSLSVKTKNFNRSFPFIGYMRLLLSNGRLEEVRALNEEWGDEADKILASPLAKEYLENMRRYHRAKGDKESEIAVLEKMVEIGDSIHSRSLSAMRSIGEDYEHRAEKAELERLSHEGRRKGVMIALLSAAFLGMATVGMWLRHKNKKRQRESEMLSRRIVALDEEHRQTMRQTEDSLEERNRKVLSMAMYLARLNGAIDSIKGFAAGTSGSVAETERLEKINDVIKDMSREENAWKMFQTYFEQVNQSFFDRLYRICPSLTNAEIKMSAFILLNMTSKEIATLTNRSVRTVDTIKHNLRKKLNISGASEAWMRRISIASETEMEEILKSACSHDNHS